MNSAFDPKTGLNSLDLPGPPEQTRVVAAMSGGVDSSVVAGLLKRAGYDVIGVTLQLYDHGIAAGRKGACCAGRDVHDARRVAAALDMPHYVLDYEQRFKDSVIEEFADSYLSGETPVPCVRCNQMVKFADLMDTARELGAKALATGHYIETRRTRARGHYAMFTAADAGRDQSYFLFATTQKQLDFLRFPLGAMTKAQTRAMARDMGLEIADKADSQDICFVPGGRYAEVIKKLRPEAHGPGDIVHVDGRRVGRHDGIVHFTIGQRRGLGVADKAPLYVTGLDAKNHIVFVGPKSALLVHDLRLREVNWLGDEPLDARPGETLDIFAKIRSTRLAAPASVSVVDGEVWVRLHDGEYGVSPGQVCVFYDGHNPGARVLGGGWIAGVENRAAGLAHRQEDAQDMRPDLPDTTASLSG